VREGLLLSIASLLIVLALLAVGFVTGRRAPGRAGAPAASIATAPIPGAGA